MFDLLIWDSDSPAPENRRVLLWRGFNTEFKKDIFSILDIVEKDKSLIRDEFVSWSYELGEKKVDNTSIKDHLEIQPNFSYWWMTLFAEKCNFSKSPEIDNAVKLIAFKRWMLSNPLKSIEIKSNNKRLNNAFNLIAKKNNLNFSSNYSFSSLDNYSTLHLIKGIIWLCLYLFKSKPLKGIGLESWQKTKSSLTFFSYLFNLDNDQLKLNNHKSNFWDNLPDRIIDQGYGLNWLHIYSPSKQIPNTKVAANIVKNFNEKNPDQVHIFLESFLNFKVIAKSIYDWITIIRLSFKLKGSLNKEDDIFQILFDDWNKSFYGICAINNCLNFNLFLAAIKSLPNQSLGLYLQENQSWEVALNYLWKEYKHRNIVGVPHSTTRFWDLRYAHDPRVHSTKNTNNYPKPSLVAINGMSQRNYFKDISYPESELELVEALRYFHLEPHTGMIKKSSISEKKDLVLILGDYLLENNHKLIDMIIRSAFSLPKTVRFIFKPHPACTVSLKEFKGLNIRILDEPLEDLLQDCSIAISSNVTTAALDAYFKGVPVACMIDSSKLNLSPMLEIDANVFVKTPQELVAKILKSFQESEIKNIDVRSFFELDSSLPRWLNFIKKALNSKRPYEEKL